MSLSKRIEESAAALRVALGQVHVPETLVVLGSGFRGFVKTLRNARHVELGSVKHFPVPAVAGHGSSLIVGDLRGTSISVLDGRSHLYEGHDPEDVVHPIRVLQHMGARRVLLTNASGSLTAKLKPGSLVVVRDQINMTGQTCLVGASVIGPQFPDMSRAFDPNWIKLICKSDRKLKTGVYVGVLGPAYETPAEARMLARLGGDVVGMSTVLEVIAARQLGMEVACLSFVTNMSGGLGKSLTHDEVLFMAKKHADWLAVTVARAVSAISGNKS